MRRAFILLLFVAFSVMGVSGQKNDYIWLSGYDSGASIDSSIYGFTYGTSRLDFNVIPRSVSHDSLVINFDKTNTAYCDANGNLLFYTNGIRVYNRLNQLIANGDGLNAGWLDETWDGTMMEGGYRNTQGILALPDDLHNKIYLVHSFVDSVPGSQGANIFCSKILSTYLDVTMNNGAGTVIYKNNPIVTGNLGREIAAIKHGNGKNWWILVEKDNSNCFYKILLSDTGFQLQSTLTCGGMAVGDTDISSAAFSPDGSKFAHFAVIGGLNIFDFDRCSGELTNPTYYPLNIWRDSSWLGNGLAFSPNSRFLYVSATKVLLQFDLWATDIASSVDTVGRYDGFRLPFGSYFNTAQLGPDGKIYISCGNSEADYHVINNPNEKGDSCNFAQHSIRLPTPSLGVPNFPNYRLGKLNGSACDTISGLNEIARSAKEQTIKVYPNPATDNVVIDYGFTDWNKGTIDLEITNDLGQQMFSQALPMYSGFQKLNISGFAAGLYTVFIKRKNTVVAVAKFVKQ